MPDMLGTESDIDEGCVSERPIIYVAFIRCFKAYTFQESAPSICSLDKSSLWAGSSDDDLVTFHAAFFRAASQTIVASAQHSHGLVM
jgi:hypothetical protein